MLKKFLTGCVSVVVLLCIAAGIGGYWAVKTYGLLQAPEIAFDEAAGPDADIVLVVQPDEARRQFVDIMRARQPNAPEWIIDLFLPYQSALLIEPDFAKHALDLTVFINEKRGGPVIVQTLNQRLQQQMPQHVEWQDAGVRLIRRGVLQLEGTSAVSQHATSEIQAIWGAPANTRHPPLEGGHFVEFAATNESGALYALYSVFAIPEGGEADFATLIALEQVKKMSQVRVHGDFRSLDVMDIRVNVRCRPGTDPNVRESLRSMLSMVMLQIAANIKQSHGLTLTGSFDIDGRDIVGDYTLTGLERVLTPSPTGL